MTDRRAPIPPDPSIARLALVTIIARSAVVVTVVVLATFANRLGDITISGDALVALYGTALGYTFGVATSTTDNRRPS